MKAARLNRLFNPKTGRCFDVAIDHGFFNEGSFLSGIEDLPKAVATLVEAAPDAIQLTVGQAPHLQKLPVRGKPALVLRTDVANVYGTRLPRVGAAPGTRWGQVGPFRQALGLPPSKNCRPCRKLHA